MKWILVFATVVAGCAAQSHDDLRPFVSAAGGYAMARKPAPEKPKVCPNCNGTGKVGDGKVFVPCPACQGGKK